VNEEPTLLFPSADEAMKSVTVGTDVTHRGDQVWVAVVRIGTRFGGKVDGLIHSYGSSPGFAVSSLHRILKELYEKFGGAR
jgi:hypothetical protein